jgi:hypothetical protein
MGQRGPKSTAPVSVLRGGGGGDVTTPAQFSDKTSRKSSLVLKKMTSPALFVPQGMFDDEARHYYAVTEFYETPREG